MADVIWEDPPLQGPDGFKGVWMQRLTPLMEHPKRWARMKECTKEHQARQLASDLRRGIRTVPPGRWEFRSSGRVVYARYLGPDDE